MFSREKPYSSLTPCSRQGIALLWMTVSALLVSNANSADFEILEAFALPGSQPMATLTPHSDGDFYGTSVAGGAFDKGTAFKTNASGQITTLFSFDGSNGEAPTSALVEGANGALYGTTEQGGTHGFGTLFKLSPSGALTTLAHFTGSTGSLPGSVPSGLAPHPNGNFYGVAQSGGATGNGTVFRLTPDSSVTVLLEFTGSSGATPGSEPVGAFAISGDTLFGLARSGGTHGKGIVYSLTLTGSYTLLAAFSGASGATPGERPSGSLLIHSNGKLYGTTESGGTDNFGVLFKIDPDGSNYSMLSAFDDLIGSKPTGTLAQAADGKIWGTAASGGNLGLGTLFSSTTTGAILPLVHFSGQNGATRGASPRGGLTLAPNGTFYGTASAGGPGERGLVFSYSPTNGYAQLDDFTTTLGWAPSGPPTRNAQGDWLFPLAKGGETGNGTIAQVSSTGAITLKVALDATVGSLPNGALSVRGTNTIGLTTKQGSSGRGGVFTLSSNGSLSSSTSFSSTAGEGFFGPLLPTQDGILYGVSQAGGLRNNGTLFSIDNNSALSRSFSFSGTSGSKKGRLPRPPLAQMPDQTIYGVTERGGVHDQGTLYRLAPNGTFTTLVEFVSSGPRQPKGGIRLAPNGKLYATTQHGGNSDQGSIIEYDLNKQTWSTVASFSGNFGSTPAGPLSLGSDGALYGIASQGGKGFGAAYRFFPDGQLESLAVFTGASGDAPGSASLQAATGIEIYGGLALGDDGLVYGTLPAGGPSGGGIAFRLDLNTLSPLESWKRDTLGDPAALDSDDPDKDGLSNLLEYAFGRVPTVFDSEGILGHELDLTARNPKLAITLPHDSTRTDIRIFVETSSSPAGPWLSIAQSDLGQTFTGSVTITETPISETINQARILDDTTATPAASRFARVRVTR